VKCLQQRSLFASQIFATTIENFLPFRQQKSYLDARI